MNFFKSWLPSVSSSSQGEQGTSVIDKISSHLQMVEEEQREYFASFAFILGRVAYADQNISEEELAIIRELLYEKSQMNESQAGAVAGIVKTLSEIDGATENYLVTRSFSEMANHQQKQELLECLFLVSAADESISTQEEKELKLIADEIGIPNDEFLQIRSNYREYREVLKGLPERS